MELGDRSVSRGAALSLLRRTLHKAAGDDPCDPSHPAPRACFCREGGRPPCFPVLNRGCRQCCTHLDSTSQERVGLGGLRKLPWPPPLPGKAPPPVSGRAGGPGDKVMRRVSATASHLGPTLRPHRQPGD